MNLIDYYRDLRAIQRGFPEPFVVVVSLKTKDGGRAGVVSEVAAEIAAGLIMNDRARVATAEEAAQFRREAKEAWEAALAKQGPQVNVMVVAESELENFKSGRKKKDSEK